MKSYLTTAPHHVTWDLLRDLGRVNNFVDCYKLMQITFSTVRSRHCTSACCLFLFVLFRTVWVTGSKSLTLYILHGVWSVHLTRTFGVSKMALFLAKCTHCFLVPPLSPPRACACIFEMRCDAIVSCTLAALYGLSWIIWLVINKAKKIGACK